VRGEGARNSRKVEEHWPTQRLHLLIRNKVIPDEIQVKKLLLKDASS
jgi:hypothetical protein